MKPETEIVDRAAFLRALANKPTKTPRKPASTSGRKKSRADKDSPKTTLSGAHSEPGQGDRTKALERLAVLHYFVRWRAGAGFDCWSPYSDVTTTPHARYADAVDAAERELRER